jgi:hypothetical protein
MKTLENDVNEIVLGDFSLRLRREENACLSRMLTPSFRSDYKNVNWKKDWETIMRKISMIEMCLPVSSVIDFGGMWEIEIGMVEPERAVYKRSMRCAAFYVADVD